MWDISLYFWNPNLVLILISKYASICKEMKKGLCMYWTLFYKVLLVQSGHLFCFHRTMSHLFLVVDNNMFHVLVWYISVLQVIIPLANFFPSTCMSSGLWLWFISLEGKHISFIKVSCRNCEFFPSLPSPAHRTLEESGIIYSFINCFWILHF